MVAHLPNTTRRRCSGSPSSGGIPITPVMNCSFHSLIGSDAETSELRGGCGWWTRWDSNPRPRRCERRALPAELLAHLWLRLQYNKWQAREITRATEPHAARLGPARRVKMPAITWSRAGTMVRRGILRIAGGSRLERDSQRPRQYLPGHGSQGDEGPRNRLRRRPSHSRSGAASSARSMLSISAAKWCARRAGPWPASRVPAFSVTTARTLRRFARHWWNRFGIGRR